MVGGHADVVGGNGAMEPYLVRDALYIIWIVVMAFGPSSSRMGTRLRPRTHGACVRAHLAGSREDLLIPSIGLI
jgi:hypothetical protein